MKVVSVREMKQLEEAASTNGVPEDTLMEAAGFSIARRINLLLDDIRGRRILFLIGPGNNGGDGLVAARHLADWGGLITLYMATQRRREDKLEECRTRRVRVLEAADDPEHWALASYLPIADLVIDAVLGIGTTGQLKEPILSLFRSVKRHRTISSNTMIAIDVPTGLNADDGSVDDDSCRADITFTLGVPKLGLFRSPGLECRGSLNILDIGLPEGITDSITLDLAGHTSINRDMPQRPLMGHKGTFGHVLVIAGSKFFVGATVLSTTAAYRAGSGLVTLASPESVYQLVASAAIETTHFPLPESRDGTIGNDAGRLVQLPINAASAVVIGPGLGTTASVQRFVENCLLDNDKLQTPFVIDADAINCLATTLNWNHRISTRAVLTPHPGEMSRLMKCTVDEVESDRVSIAQKAASQWNQVVVLKGAHTVVAAPDGRTTLSPYANPALASGGTGDVLSGIIGSMLGQGLDTYEAAKVGVHIHGEAGERVRKRTGDAGLLASDLLPEVPKAMNDIRTWTE